MATMSFSGKNLDRLFDMAEDAIANIDNEAGQVDNVQSEESKEHLANLAEIKAEYVALRQRIFDKRST